MEVFLLPFENRVTMQQLQEHIDYIEHLTYTLITPTLLSCSTDGYFTLHHETDCHTLLETLLFDLNYTTPYLYGTIPAKTPLINTFLTQDVWQNVNFSKKMPLWHVLPQLALNPLLSKATLTLLDETAKLTLRHFFENSLNVMQTAKQMYIHRNTLNYRLAHIYEQTGIDPRTFYGAMYFFNIITTAPLFE